LQQASLIVAPTSLVGNWYDEAKRFTPDLKVLVFHGFERHHDEFDGYDLVISTYGLVQRDKLRFLAYPFYYLILDEAQFIKNARTKTTQIMQQLQAKYRLCLTGTPLENHLGELWSLFHFLMPGLLGAEKQFNHLFRTPIEKNADQDQRHIPQRKLRDLASRRILPFLPKALIQQFPQAPRQGHFGQGGDRHGDRGQSQIGAILRCGFPQSLQNRFIYFCHSLSHSLSQLFYFSRARKVPDSDSLRESPAKSASQKQTHHRA